MVTNNILLYTYDYRVCLDNVYRKNGRDANLEIL